MDSKSKQYICKLYKAFHYKDHYFMIFESMGLSLYDLLKKNKKRGYNMKLV